MRKFLRTPVIDFLVVLSLTNLTLLSQWTAILAGNFVGRNSLIAVLFMLAVGTTIGGLSAWLLRRTTRPAAGWLGRVGLVVWVAVIVGILTKTSLAVEISTMKFALGLKEVRLVYLAAIILASAIGLRYLRPLALVAHVAALALVPFAFLTIAQTVWYLVSPPASQPDTSMTDTPVMAANGGKNRILFMLFDEMQYSLAVTDRPAGLAMPQLDRLRAESLFATNAFPPGSMTRLSMPAMFTGRLVDNSSGPPSQQTIVTFHDGEQQRLSASDNLIKDLVHNGKTVIRLGGIFGSPGDLGVPEDSRVVRMLMVPSSPSLGRALLNGLRNVLESAPLGGRISPPETTSEINDYITNMKRFIAQAARLAAKGDSDFTYIHFMLPHMLSAFDRVSGEFAPDTDHRDYVANLAASDKVLGEIRQAMETAGTWDSTVVILTADHWYRTGVASGQFTSDHRVPFVVKPAGAPYPVEFDKPFNTVLFRAMVMAFADGEIATAQDLAMWLDSHRSFGESPLTIHLK